MKNNDSNLFFSMSYEFLGIYMVKQLGRSLDTIESYRDALSIFRRYVLNELNISINNFTFANYFHIDENTGEKYSYKAYGYVQVSEDNKTWKTILIS
jgi:hypothetical protein